MICSRLASCRLSLSLTHTQTHTHTFLYCWVWVLLDMGFWEGGVQGRFVCILFETLLAWDWTAVPDGLHGCKLASSSLEFKGCYWIGFMGYTDLPETNWTLCGL